MLLLTAGRAFGRLGFGGRDRRPSRGIGVAVVAVGARDGRALRVPVFL